MVFEAELVVLRTGIPLMHTVVRSATYAVFIYGVLVVSKVGP